MTENPPGDEEVTKEELKAELLETRTRVRELERELAETNEGMVALTVELENAKDRYQTIFEESTDGILLIHPERDLIYEANPEACDLLGYDHNVLVTLSPDEIFPDEQYRADTFAEAVVHGWIDEITCRTKDGRRIDVDISAARVSLDGRSLLLASLRDITERKRREQRLQVLTRIFRHNLRNDGNVIQGHADILYDQVADTELEQHVARIRGTIDTVLGLSNKVRRVQDILDQERAYQGSLSELLTAHQERFAESHPSATLTCRLPENDIPIDHRLGVAIREAIENALQHSDGESTVSITAEVDEDRDRITIDIEDDGPGIPEHELEVVRTGIETPTIHGSGIGLWSISWVVDSLGGDVTIQRREPTGTIISMAVPLQSIEGNRELRH